MSAAYFDLQLSPNRSFDPRRLPWLLGAVALVVALASLRFLALGAWPVIPFMAVDAALLAWAFRASYRSGRARERILLDGEQLTVSKIDPQGRLRRFDFQPHWTRVVLERIDAQQNRLWLASRGQRLRIGWFLSPAEREQIHDVIRDGLWRYRSASPSTSDIA